MREGTFFWLFALAFAPVGIALLLSGIAERLGVPGWRLLRWLPVAALVATYIGYKTLF